MLYVIFTVGYSPNYDEQIVELYLVGHELLRKGLYLLEWNADVAGHDR